MSISFSEHLMCWHIFTLEISVFAYSLYTALVLTYKLKYLI